MARRADAPHAKPIEGWRDFLKEVATIILGVAIALAAGEAVDDYNWAREVAVVKESLDDELDDALFAARERIQIADCQHRTLDRLDELADASGGPLMIRNSPVSRNRLWASSAWEAAVASGAIAHMGHDERHAYAVLFSYVRLFHELNLRQQELWSRVEAYRRPRTLTEDAGARFVETVSELRSLTGSMNAAARKFVERAEPLGIEISAADAAALGQPLRCPMP